MQSNNPAICARPMNILLSNMYGGLGGGEIALLAHAQRLIVSGERVTVALLEDGPLVQRLNEAGVEVVVMPFQWQGSKHRSIRLLIERIRGFIRLISTHAIDLAICYTLNDLVMLGTAARLKKVPLFYRAQGDVLGPDKDLHGTWLGRYFPLFLRWCRPMFASTTHAEAERLRSLTCIHPGQVHLVYLGVDSALGNPRRDAWLRLRTELGWGRAPIIAQFGRLVRFKGQVRFLLALGELQRRGLEFGAWIVGGSSFGDGSEYEHELIALAEAQGLSKKVRFLGFRTDIADLLHACDIVCNPSDWEPFGLAIVEGMMAGRPVVATDNIGPRESIISGETGLLVQARAPEQLADALESLLVDEKRRVSMGERAQTRAREMFDRDRNLDALHALCIKHVVP